MRKILFILLLVFVSSLQVYAEDSLVISDLKSVSGGSKYIKSIDSTVGKLATSPEKLVSIQKKISKNIPILVEKKDIKTKQILKIINYLNFKIDEALYKEDEILYHKNGNVSLITRLNSQGNVMGVREAFYENGNKYLLGSYINGQLHGKTYIFDENGNISQLEEYRNNILIKGTQYILGKDYSGRDVSLISSESLFDSSNGDILETKFYDTEGFESYVSIIDTFDSQGGAKRVFYKKYYPIEDKNMDYKPDNEKYLEPLVLPYKSQEFENEKQNGIEEFWEYDYPSYTKKTLLYRASYKDGLYHGPYERYTRKGKEIDNYQNGILMDTTFYDIEGKILAQSWFNKDKITIKHDYYKLGIREYTLDYQNKIVTYYNADGTILSQSTLDFLK